MACYGKKCPIMLLFLGAFTCGFAPNKQKCLSYGSLCSYTKSTKQCELDENYVMDLLIPKTCWMRPLLQESMTCGSTQTQSACKRKRKCKWRTKTMCARMRVTTESICDSNGDWVSGRPEWTHTHTHTHIHTQTHTPSRTHTQRQFWACLGSALFVNSKHAAASSPGPRARVPKRLRQLQDLTRVRLSSQQNLN